MTLPYLVSTVLLAGLTLPAHAASFPCGQAQRPVEKLICGDAGLNAADELMGRTYRNALSKLSTAGVGTVRADQVQWLAWVQEVCRTNEPLKATALSACLRPLYVARTKQLRTTVLLRDGVTFLIRTQYLAEPEKADATANGVEYPGFGTLQASWPAADSPDAKWIAWNQAMEANAFAVAGGSDTAQTAVSQKPLWVSSLASEQDITVLGQVKSLEHDRVTASMNTESMGHGAAHPNESFETMTWLLDSGRSLRAEDVFAPASEWKQKVATACWKAISTGEQKGYIYSEVTGPDAKQLLDVITDVRNWTIESDGLHVSYPEYTVTPRAAPLNDTVIDWAQLKPMLATGFVAP
ncbi:MAG: DUF3298 domain-containing protein [Janthinobacterium lividum]